MGGDKSVRNSRCEAVLSCSKHRPLTIDVLDVVSIVLTCRGADAKTSLPCGEDSTSTGTRTLESGSRLPPLRTRARMDLHSERPPFAERMYQAGRHCCVGIGNVAQFGVRAPNHKGPCAESGRIKAGLQALPLFLIVLRNIRIFDKAATPRIGKNFLPRLSYQLLFLCKDVR